MPFDVFGEATELFFLDEGTPNISSEHGIE